MRLELLGDGGRQLGIERREHLAGQLDEGDVEPALTQILRGLHADEPAPDHDRAARPRSELTGDQVGVRDIPQGAGPLDARQLGHEGAGAGAEHDPVVRLLVLPRALDLAHPHGPCGPVDGHHPVPYPHINTEAGVQRRGGLQEQGIALADGAAEVVRQSAVGIADMSAALEHDDLRLLVEPAQPGGGGHAAGRASDHDDLHVGSFQVRPRP